MPLRGSRLTMKTGSEDIQLYVEEIREIPLEIDAFDRPEFSHDRLRSAKNSDGSSPVFIQLFGGRVAQLFTTCGNVNTTRSVLPDDSVVSQIKRRWDIRRWTITGSISTAQTVAKLADQAEQDRIKFARYQAHIQEVGMDISYQRLLELQAETFSYLQTTSLSMYGNALPPMGYLSAGCSIGETSLSTTYANKFQGGRSIIIDGGSPNEEINTITSVSVDLLGVEPLAKGHPNGTKFQNIETNLLISSFRSEVNKEFRSPGTYIPEIRKVWEMVVESRVNRAASA